MPNYLCRPTELNSSSPVLPEGGGEKRERDRWNGGRGGEQTDRERETERERERGGRERVRERGAEVNYMDIHVHSRKI